MTKTGIFYACADRIIGCNMTAALFGSVSNILRFSKYLMKRAGSLAMNLERNGWLENTEIFIFASKLHDISLS